MGFWGLLLRVWGFDLGLGFGVEGFGLGPLTLRRGLGASHLEVEGFTRSRGLGDLGFQVWALSLGPLLYNPCIHNT